MSTAVAAPRDVDSTSAGSWGESRWSPQSPPARRLKRRLTPYACPTVPAASAPVATGTITGASRACQLNRLQGRRLGGSACGAPCLLAPRRKSAPHAPGPGISARCTAPGPGIAHKAEAQGGASKNGPRMSRLEPGPERRAVATPNE
jgi:hypothetical protein